MSPVPKKELAALGLEPEMLGPSETLPLPAAAVDQALGPSALAPSVVPLDAHSDVMRTIGVDLRLDGASRALEFEWASDTGVRVRDAHPAAPPYAGATDQGLRVPLRQLGRFLIESIEGVALVVGALDDDSLHLVAVGPWPSPPLAQWIPPMTDAWLQLLVQRSAPGADAWGRAALAGVIARLSAPAPPEVSSASGRASSQVSLFADGVAAALLRRVSQSPAMLPRTWARALDPAAVDALEEHARRRALTLAGDLEDALGTQPIETDEARATWTRLCHRRDDLESVRVLLAEAAAGDRLDEALREADRAGRMLRAGLGAGLTIDDERLRRVALGDPGAWWGDPHLEVRLL